MSNEAKRRKITEIRAAIEPKPFTRWQVLAAAVAVIVIGALGFALHVAFIRWAVSL